MTTARNGPERDASEEVAIQIRIAVDKTVRPERIYSNHVEFATSPVDITLLFCDIEPSEGPRVVGDHKEISATPKVAIVMSREFFSNFTDAIEKLKRLMEGSTP